MLSRLASASARGFLVAIMVMMPALMLPTVASDTAEIIALVAIFAAVLTTIEYSSSYPSIIEFRDAPPFNRVRFLSLFITVILIATMCRGEVIANNLSIFVMAVGALIANVLDFPFSPVRMMSFLLPENVSPHQLLLIRASTALSMLIALLSLAFFVIMLSSTKWPKGLKGFNVWVNLPTFDPSAGADVVERLNRDALVNVGLGLIMLYFVPVTFWGASVVFKPIDVTSHHTMIWVVAAWAFLPASLFMRGIAMRRVAEMIAERRRRNEKLNQALVAA